MVKDHRTSRIIARHFAFLDKYGFRVVEGTYDVSGEVKYVTEAVLVSVSWDWREELAGISIVRRRMAETLEEPYWAGVTLREILKRRSPGDRSSWLQPPDFGRGPGRDTIFAQGAELLRAHGDDLLRGEHLEFLDEIIATRPRRGVPGLDFAADKPWAASREGLWFFTDSQRPQSVETYLQRSRRADPAERAVAALKLPVGMRVTADPAARMVGLTRLRELLGDPNADVRRAAASSLGTIGDTDSLDRIVELLVLDEGDQPSPYAAAVTFIAFDLAPGARRRVLDRLHDFAAKGPVAALQVAELAWRFGEGDPPGR